MVADLNRDPIDGSAGAPAEGAHFDATQAHAAPETPPAAAPDAGAAAGAPDGEAGQPPQADDAAEAERAAEAQREEQLTRLFTATVMGPSDERIGKVGQVYLDDQTQEPNWITVRTGLFGSKEFFVPLDEAQLDGKHIIVPYTKVDVTSAPPTEIDQNLSPDEEDALYNHYRVPGRMTDAALQDAAVADAAPGSGAGVPDAVPGSGAPGAEPFAPANFDGVDDAPAPTSPIVDQAGGHDHQGTAGPAPAEQTPAEQTESISLDSLFDDTTSTQIIDQGDGSAEPGQSDGHSPFQRPQ